jgi:hypothetical protein
MDGHIVFLTMLQRSTVCITCSCEVAHVCSMLELSPAYALSSNAYLCTNDALRLGLLFGLLCLGVLGALHGQD